VICDYPTSKLLYQRSVEQVHMSGHFLKSPGYRIKNIANLSWTC